MKVYVAVFFALLIVGGATFPVWAVDHKTTVPGWSQMSKEEQSKTIREISSKHKLRRGHDNIIIQPAPKNIDKLGQVATSGFFDGIADAVSCVLRGC